MDNHRQDVGAGEQLPAQETLRKQGLLDKSKDFLQSAMDSITGKELPRLVEDFTRDMVVVAEGLSADQQALETALKVQGEEQDKLAARQRELDKQLHELNKKVEALTSAQERRRRGQSGLASILRQATWLAAIIGASWIIATLIRAIVR